MRRQTVIALGIALVLGFMAVYLANVYLSRSDARADAVQTSMAKVAVAAIPLDYGVQLTPDKVKFVDYPASSLPPGTFSQWAQLVPAGKQRVVIRPITLNEPILASKLAGEGMGASIAYLLPDGMRAAAVRINDVSGVAGFVQPSDAVDVLITRELPGGQVTDVLLQNVKVIAIDQRAQGADGKPALAKTATLEVAPTDAQKLALAQQVGSLSLVLRKPGQEQDAGRLETVSMSDLRYSYYGARPINAAASTNAVRTVPRRIIRRPVATTRPASPPRPATSSIQIIRGTEGSNYEVGGYGS